MVSQVPFQGHLKRLWEAFNASRTKIKQIGWALKALKGLIILKGLIRPGMASEGPYEPSEALEGLRAPLRALRLLRAL